MHKDGIALLPLRNKGGRGGTAGSGVFDNVIVVSHSCILYLSPWFSTCNKQSSMTISESDSTVSIS